MEEKQSAVEKFLGDIEGQDKNPFQENIQDPFNKEIEPTEEISEEPKEEKAVPFNKDPKVLRFIERELDKRIKDIQFNEKPVKEAQTVDDDYYIRLIGNDTPERLLMIKEYKEREERLLQQAEERAFNRLSQKEQEELRAEQEAEQELETAFDTIEETYDVDFSTSTGRKTRQEFVSFVEKIAPKDRNGNVTEYPDMTSAWETYQELKKSTVQPNRAKELASRSMTRSAETNVQSSGKRVTFADADAFIESLK